MRTSRFFAREKFWRGCWILLVLETALCCAQSQELKLEAQLIWATNDGQAVPSPYKPVERRIAKKLRSMPFRWKNFFEVNRTNFTLPARETRSIQLSAPCSLSVRDLGASRVEAKLYGQKRLVNTVKQALTNDEVLVIGGDDNGETAWLVILAVRTPSQ